MTNIHGKISNTHIQWGPGNMSFSSTAETYLVFFHCVQVIQGLSDWGYILFYQLGYKTLVIAMGTWVCICLDILLSSEHRQTGLWIWQNHWLPLFAEVSSGALNPKLFQWKKSKFTLLASILNEYFSFFIASFTLLPHKGLVWTDFSTVIRLCQDYMAECPGHGVRLQSYLWLLLVPFLQTCFFLIFCLIASYLSI